VFTQNAVAPDQNVTRAPSQRTRLPESLPKKPCPGGESVPVITPKFGLFALQDGLAAVAAHDALGLLKCGVLVK